MPNRIAPALACLAWLTATTAIAQPIHEPPHVVLVDPASAQTAPAPSTTVSPLTVEAAPSPKAIEKRSQTFVQTYAAAPNPEVDQIARWHDGVCVKVGGMIEVDQAAKIAARIGEVAKSLKLRVLAAGCKANIQIKFTERPQDVLDEVAEKQENLLGFHYPADLKALKTVTHPVQAWYATATVGGGGDLAGPATAILMPSAGGSVPPPAAWHFQAHQEVIDDPRSQPPVGCGDSPHFTACLKGVFKNVLIVADSGVVQGRDLGAVADYLAMLALSQPKSLDGCYALPSVIDLLVKSPCPGRDPPGGLTPADAAYLTALYTADLAAKKAGEQDDIARRMARILISASTTPKAPNP